MTFPSYWECHHPNWRTHILQRGRYTTNQMTLLEIAFSFFFQTDLVGLPASPTTMLAQLTSQHGSRAATECTRTCRILQLKHFNITSTCFKPDSTSCLKTFLQILMPQVAAPERKAFHHLVGVPIGLNIVLIVMINVVLKCCFNPHVLARIWILK